ncbi:MAG: glycoside hydrolase family 2 [Clostridia bacterium]|nr:glycoside hydrolase family 2 [Clostridia bacterium]
MKKISLNGKWKLYFYNQLEKDIKNPSELGGEQCIKCSVPGNVELDLSAAGLLPEDLYFGTNMKECEKFETYAWWYEKEFEIDKSILSEKLYLHFNGVDCIAEYFLNGEKIGESENMLTEHEFCIDGVKREKNILHVKINSFVLREHEEEFSERSLLMNPFFHQKSVELRKAPHMHGWDILPRAVSAGIWRDAELVSKGDFEFRQFTYIPVKYEYGNMLVCFCYDIACPYDKLKNSKIIIKGSCKGRSFETESLLQTHGGRIELCIENALLWWPKGYGEANLYDVKAQIVCDGKVVAEYDCTMGLRTIKLLNSYVADKTNGKFAFEINGKEIFCLGTNWVALDAFHSRDKERYDKALALLDDIGCNMVRMWGGNVYEDTAFYDFCDSHGIMVWQDFTMACNAYPHSEKFLKEIEKEAVFIIKKLRNHASLTLWAGDNECDSMLTESIWTDPNSNIITRDILKRAVFNHDTWKPYLPSSPYYGSEVMEKGGKIQPAEQHVWGPRDYFKSDFYSENDAHFISECGYHGMPCRQTLEKFLENNDMKPGVITENNILHSTDWKGSDHRVRLVSDQVIQLFSKVPDNMDDYILASQISQAEAMKYFVERMRINRPQKSGILWWNLVDGWPHVSDAVVDYYFEKKLAYDYIKQSQQPFCIMMDEIQNWNSRIVASNNTLENVNGVVRVSDGESKQILFEKEFSVMPNCSEALGEIKLYYSEKRLFVIEWETDKGDGFNHYISGGVPFSLEKYKKWIEII